jgi:hypothetical protein
MTGNIVFSGSNLGLGWVGATALGYATTGGSYSSSAAAGNLEMRCDTGHNLILQSGSGAAAIIIIHQTTQQ